ncbi:MAG TPA: hypothetical protein VIP08_08780 [Phenylobacterium sp.]|uniref:hypothetical protein n=1 Tax=Phenylobacterium sp. TaxID=1871053 RepID=UPI002F922099
MSGPSKRRPAPFSALWRAITDPALVKVWARVGAGVAMTVAVFVAGYLIALGPWKPEHQARQILYLLILAVGCEVLILVALAAIWRIAVDLHGGRDGIHVTIDQDGPASPGDGQEGRP